MKSIYIDSISKTLKVFSPLQRTRAIFVFGSTIISALMDVLGIAVILPVLYLISDPSPIQKNRYLSSLKDFLAIQSDNQFILCLVILLVVAFILKNVIGTWLLYLQESFVGNLNTEIINREFAKYLSKDYEYHLNTNSTKTVQEITRIPTEFTRVVVSSLLQLSVEYFVVFFILLFLCIYSINIFIMLCATILPVLWVLNSITRNKINEYGNKRNEIQNITYKQVTEAIHAYVDVKITNNEKFFIDRAYVMFRAYATVMTRLKVFQALPNRIIETIAVLAIALLYYFVTFVSEDPSQMVVVLVLFASATYRIMPSLNRILGSLMLIRSTQFVFDHLHEYEKSEIEFGSHEGKIDFEKEIVFSDISYTYPGANHKTLDSINLTISKGQTVGVIGESGSGKTTLGKILLRLLIEAEGTLTIDGNPITGSNLRSWNNLLGYVRQDFYLMDASLAENIAFGQSPAQIDAEKVNQIIDQVKLRELVSRLKDGIYTRVGEFGSNLSGGQRQRIAIARALYWGASLLVLDEATSALDSTTEEEIMKMIYDLHQEDLTIFIIAHRLTTLKSCDVIYELEKGKLINTYTYDQLSSSKIKS